MTEAKSAASITRRSASKRTVGVSPAKQVSSLVLPASFGLRGRKRRPKTDWPTRHVRDLLLIGKLPESWIPADHVLDLRAAVRCCHALSHQRTKWCQRIQFVLDHHGCPQRRQLMTAHGREWLDAQPLPATAREQIAVALTMVGSAVPVG